jgi:hypothetical protein
MTDNLQPDQPEETTQKQDKQEICKINTDSLLTHTEKGDKLSRVPGIDDIVGALQGRLSYRKRRLAQLRQEMAKLSDAYNRYMDLRREVEQGRIEMNKIKGTLGPGYEFEEDLDTDDASYARKNLSLWEAIEEVILVAGETRIVDVEETLRGLELPKITRQGIESAIETHPKVFKTVRRGREKYVMLKEE